MKWLCLSIGILMLFSCQNRENKQIRDLIREWEGKVMLFPDFSMMDTIGQFVKTDFTIVTYIDSLDCFSCKLNFRSWMNIKHELTSGVKKVSFLFFLQMQRTEKLDYMLKWDASTLPICFDTLAAFDNLNKLPIGENFRTFLLDDNNKVLAIGNPVLNSKVKELYLKIIRGEEVGGENKTKVVKTKLNIAHTSVSLGSFDWKEEQKTAFVIKNTGDKLLVIEGVSTSCGCTTVTYSKEPVQPGKEIVLEVSYKAEHPEHFNKTITVYCNAETSPLVLQINGNAK